jgi:hypothetical protein
MAATHCSTSAPLMMPAMPNMHDMTLAMLKSCLPQQQGRGTASWALLSVADLLSSCEQFGFILTVMVAVVAEPLTYYPIATSCYGCNPTRRQ